MTSNEAKQKVDECERQIVSTYNTLKDNARAVGTSAASAASSKTTANTVWPLLLCVLGFVFFAGPWFLGLVCIISGAVIAYNLHNSAQTAQNSIENGQKNLNSIIDTNANI